LIVTEPRQDIAAWVGAKIGVSFSLPYTAIGEIRNGKLIAAYVFNMWTAHDVEVSLAADRLTKTLMTRAFAYVVNELGCRRATFRTRADNLPAQKCLERLGARLEGCQRLYFGDCDGLIYGIMKEDFPLGQHPKSADAS
jgi:hypothetical protein